MKFRNIVTFLTLAWLPLTGFAAGTLQQARDIISEVKGQYAPDSRQVVFEISAKQGAQGIVLTGNTSEREPYAALLTRLGQDGITFTDSINVYPTNSWAQVRIPAASLRTAGRHAAEMATQAIMGTPLRVLEKGGEWWRVQTPDGYIAYVPSSSVVSKTADEMERWRSAERYIVTSPWQIRVYDSPTATGPRNVVTDLVNGSIVEVEGSRPDAENGRLHLRLPDGRTGYADLSAFKTVETWAAQDFNPDQILDIAYSMEGTPYLWGGTSTKALDCSGLAKVSYFSNGIILMRDASQQATTGTRIEASDWRSNQAGDLLFFGNARTGKVTHVAIYDNNGNYVHSSGRVKRNSVDPASDSYLSTPFLHSVRIAGNEGTRGITRARDHAWYFNVPDSHAH